MTNTSPRSSASREKLLVAGTRLIAEQGIDSIHTNLIARVAGVGVGTFYNHFDDKHALYCAVVSRGLDAVRIALREAHGRVEGEAITDQVRAGVIALVDIAESQPELFRAAFGGPSGTGPRARAHGLSPRPIEQRLRALQHEGRIDSAIDPGVAARAFTEMQVSVVRGWLEDPAASTRAAVIETLVRMHPAIACRSGRS